MKKRLILIITTLILTFSLASCGGNDDNPTTKPVYTVTFNSNGGSSVAGQEVEEGSKVSKPTNPTRDGHEFGSWYSDSSLNDEWDFDNDVVNSNLTLYASWTEVEFNGYTTNVVYENGTPVVGVSVQWCNDKTCFIPVTTDSNGVAKNSTLAEGTYYVHVMENSNFPEGYTYDSNAYTVIADSKEVTITLLAVDEITSGEGTNTNPYVLTGEGNYLGEVTSNSDILYYAFTPNEIGTYTFESHVTYIQATNPLDLMFAVCTDSTFNLNSAAITLDGGVGYNFKGSVEVTEAGQTIYVLISSRGNQEETNYGTEANPSSVEFYFSVVKN